MTLSNMPPLPETVTTPLAALDDYEDRFGPVPADQDDVTTQALTDASSIVRALVNLTISQVEGDMVTVDGSGTPLLLLPEWPVTDVSAVLELQPDDTWMTLDADDYEWSEAKGIVYRRKSARWPYRPRAVTLTYTHGWEVVPADVVRVVCQMAQRALTMPDGRDVRSKTLGQASITYVDVGRVGLTAWEETVLQKLRLR